MLKYINAILCEFRPCFTREKTYHWFVIVIMGLMLRSDHLGVTSVMRDLLLPAQRYETLMHFFRSTAWSLESLRLKWLEVVKRIAPLFRLNGRVALVGDGMKLGKEARHMPGVKKLHQESENSSKVAYIFGPFIWCHRRSHGERAEMVLLAIVHEPPRWGENHFRLERSLIVAAGFICRADD
ncbi:transposase [Natribacillus halophilus]|nr:transposase [Natribacillus halophilus]